MTSRVILPLVIAVAATTAGCGPKKEVAVAEADNEPATGQQTKMAGPRRSDERPTHGDHTHAFADPAGRAKTWNDPARDEWQRPEEIVAALALKPGATVADIGAGTGYMVAGNKEGALYRLLLTAQCNALHTAMPFLFERIDDETELLLPDNLLNSDSLIRKLVGEIDEEDWKEVEIIGWLYQFYISEKKDEVMGRVASRIDQLDGDKAKATSTSHRKKLQKEQDDLKKQQAELLAFEEKLKHAADQKIALDLDDGVKVNYGKFGDLLAEAKAITGGKDDE